jgi:GNAT superfamily N-acetyltransferase
LAVLIRLLEESDSVSNFDCGDEPLNRYLQRYAWINQQKSLIGVTYVAVEESAPGTVLGYFTLATCSMPREKLPKRATRGLPAYDLPMLLLARLAVDTRFEGRGLGQALLGEALRISFRISQQVGCRYLVVDAYPAAVEWYKRFGFQPIEGGKGNSVRMYLDIRTIAAAQHAD